MDHLRSKYGPAKSLRWNYFQLARSYVQNNQFENAIKTFRKASEQQGSVPFGWEIAYSLGQCYENQKRPVEAVMSYIKGIISIKGVQSSQQNLSMLLDQLSHVIENDHAGKLPASKDNFKQKRFTGLGRDEEMILEPLLHVFHGKVFLSNNDLTAAEKHFNSLSKDAPIEFQIEALHGLGEIHYKNKNFRLAKEKLEAAIAADKENHFKPKISLLYIRTLIATEEHLLARNKLKDYRLKWETGGASPTSDEITQIASCYLMYSLWNDALFFVQQLKAKDTSEFSYSVKIESYLALHRYSLAFEELQDATEAYPSSHHLLFLKIQAYVEGQLNIIAGSQLFLENYASEESEENIQKRLQLIKKRRPEDQNARYFVAFIYVLMGKEETVFEQYLEQVRKEGILDDVDSNAPSTYPEKAIHVLDGYSLEFNGKKEEAANQFYEAGKKCYWEGKYEHAVFYIEKAIELDPSHNPMYWHLADSYKLLSTINEPPYNDPYYVGLAYRVWSSQPQGFVIEKKEQYWGYLVGSRIHDLGFYFEETLFLQNTWLSILYAERAIIYEKNKATVWTDLGKCYNNIGLYHNSFEALTKAMEYDPEDIVNIDEYTKVLLNLYRFQEAEKYISRLEDKTKYPYLAWKGFIAYIKGDYHKALHFFNEYLKDTPLDVWSHGIKMECFWLLQDFGEAKNCAAQILELSKNKNIQRQEYTYAMAAFITGETKKAIAIAADAVTKSGDPYYLDSHLLLFYLYDNELSNATDQFEHHLRVEKRPEALELTIQKLGHLKQFAKAGKLPHEKELAAIIGNTETGWIKRLRDQIKSNALETYESVEELKNILEQNKYHPGSVQWLTIKAGLARRSWENGEYAHASKYYHELIGFMKDFPDAKFALEEIRKEIIEVTKERLKKSEYDTVLMELKDGFVEGPEASALLLLAYLGVNQRKQAKALLMLHLKESKQHDKTLADDGFIASLLESIPSNRLFWKLDDLMNACLQDVDDQDITHLIKSIQDLLNTYWIKRLGDGQTSNYFLAVTPIAIEIGTDMVPEGEELEWPVFKEFIPNLRDDFQQRYHVQIPGIRIRENDNNLPDGTYYILIDEIPIGSGTVRKNEFFVPSASEELEKLGLTYNEIQYPFAGAWVARSNESSLKEHNIIYWDDPFKYIIAHLDLALAQRLDFFYDVNYTYDYLNGFEAFDPDVRTLADEIKSDNQLLLLFDQVLRGLLKEQVPANQRDVIIQNFMDTDLHVDQKQRIQKIRLNLKSVLPGNQPHLKRIKLPRSVEQQIQDELKKDENKTFLGMEPVVCQEVLTEIREVIANQPFRKIVLEVERSELRPYVRELIKLEFADLMVIAKEEIWNETK
ncbi:tetratricopeptide repeat protein [Flavobacteriaceae bacterium TP-CH-4]|uniref:Tetratricopeptide repeat protein n=1 Tax=Pelagihabitans pacificus TaxID=2696054 RepID=A0A967APH7_9FLAO|nr:FHIPEP family type III secretion protein [Pelagihabitans pacificus]NHF58041.1 tetratricopeptide repeat protein [Pelagihabitans pacificus]